MDRQVGRWQVVSDGGGAVRQHVGPLLQQGCDEPLGLSVGLRCVGPGRLGLQSHGLGGVPPTVKLGGAAQMDAGLRCKELERYAPNQVPTGAQQ